MTSRGWSPRNVGNVRGPLMGLLFCGLLFLLVGCSLIPSKPVASFATTSTEGDAPLHVTLKPALSNGAGEYAWSFGDGEQETRLDAVVVDHWYAKPGVYACRLEVAGANGETASCEQVITAIDPGTNYYLALEWDYRQQIFLKHFEVPGWLYDFETRPRKGGPLEIYITDSYGYITALSELIVEGDPYRAINNILFFVQAVIDYKADGPENYPQYPIETLVKGTGDCEDTVILFISLLQAQGYEASIYRLDQNADGTVDHVMAMVPVDALYAETCLEVWQKDGLFYAPAETSVDPERPYGYWPVGGRYE